ncbi:hypothetical protein BCR42DRAFT_399240 [Absidia repens]|uniref:Uncharacterized protein n=1 Tax=Absidia repens TaxID=90262 RepID=A0A1X2IZM7_9FUNG|nr:hypothetical protein BCR42DRAFT_399240 [Absidia repens]
MIRSPLHLLISLQRFLYRSKARHKSSLIFSRPITKSTSWSATIALRIPKSSTPISAKSIPASVQQEPSHHLLRMMQRQSPTTLSSTTRRLLISRQSPGQSRAAVYVQSRTMLSSGNATNHQLTTVLNPAQFFTPRPPILGVHGGILPPPVPQTSLRSYANHPPWAIQQHQQMGPSVPLSPSSANIDMDDVDNSHDDDFCNNIRYHQHTHQRLLTNTKSVAATHDSTESNSRQQSYRPPNMRGMADLMERDNDDDRDDSRRDMDGMGSNRHSPGLVHRGQPPKKWSPRQKQTAISARRMSDMDVLRHDDLSLQTTKKRRSSASVDSTTNTIASKSATLNDDGTSELKDLTQQWYISIPMDLSLLMHPENPTSTPTSSEATPSSAAGNLFFMENAVSILDPIWMKSFDLWGKLIRNHLTKVMVLVQLIGLEAQRYYAKGRRRNSANDAMERHDHYDHPGDSDTSTGEVASLETPKLTTTATTTTRMDFKMMVMKKANTPSELRIYLPHQLCTPLPTTIQNIQLWVHQLMKDPPCFEVKYGEREPSTDDRDEEHGTTHRSNDLATAMMNDGLFDIPTDGMDDNADDRGMEMDDFSESNNGNDNDPWHIGPHYFQGIHSFLNHVDSMIDSSPAFATGGQRRFSL